METASLVNDYVVMEHICNSDCRYCITTSSKFKEKHSPENRRFNAHVMDDGCVYAPGSSLYETMNVMTKRLHDNRPAHILKISGGEILMIPGILDYIKKHSCQYERLQVLTNGLLLDKSLLQEISEIPNLCLQLSMDGHSLELNRYRVTSSSVQQHLLDRLGDCSRLGMPVEINCVLTNANMTGLPEFARYLSQYDNVLLMPYPVRGIHRDRFWPGEMAASSFEKLFEEWERLCHILPPKAYLNHLSAFMRGERKTYPCRVPLLIYQSFDDGILTPCPNIWFKSIGNIMQDEFAAKNINSDPFYTLIRRQSSVLEECFGCYTPWDILNLFLFGEITLEEMKLIHLYNTPTILSYLTQWCLCHG